MDTETTELFVLFTVELYFRYPCYIDIFITDSWQSLTIQ